MPSIINTVARLFTVSAEQLVSKKRTQEIALARQVAMYLARTLTNLSLKSIGAEFGGRDHSTVIHAVGVVRDSMGQDPELKSHVDQAVAVLYSGNTPSKL
jgi:chromosomal replication initiator protein